jgi:hypothetical protein
MGSAWALAALLCTGCSDDGIGNPQTGTGTETGGASLTAADDGASADPGTAGNDGASRGARGGGGDTGLTGGDTTGGDTGGGPDLSCESDLDCQLVNDCCACGAVNAEEMVVCDEPPCVQPMCGDTEPTPVCELGECTIEWSCAEPVDCAVAPPPCEEGTLPSIADGCFTGACVPVDQCDAVPDCSFCTANQVCVTTEALPGPSYSCLPMPEACGGTPSCACLEGACNPRFEICVDGRDGITCSCPAC